MYLLYEGRGDLPEPAPVTMAVLPARVKGVGVGVTGALVALVLAILRDKHYETANYSRLKVAVYCDQGILAGYALVNRPQPGHGGGVTPPSA